MTDNQTAPNDNSSEILALTADIVTAYVGNNSISANDIGALIQNTHTALSGLNGPAVAPEAELVPAVPIRKSIQPDYLVCLEDGKQMKMMRRYLSRKFNMTPEQYRQKWNLPKDYPMTAPNYARLRSDMAHKIGLGRKEQPVEQPPEPVAQKPEPVAAAPAKSSKQIAEPAPKKTTGKVRGGATGKTRRTKAEMDAARAAGAAKPKKARANSEAATA